MRSRTPTTAPRLTRSSAFVSDSLIANPPECEEAQPFLKWVGGKTQLLAQIEPLFPPTMERYVEPFVGGGAVYFHLRARFPKMRPALRDNNPELVNAFTVVRDASERLMALLDEHLANYRKDAKGYYYSVRSQHHLAESIERAARMVFLNKTCFNGLWRVNSRGEFNVPMGSYKKPRLYVREDIMTASRALQGADIKAQDFRQTLSQVRRGDFVYVDPPYHPLSRTSAFTAYTKDEFGEREQRDLAGLFASAAKRGARLMLSNSDAPFIRGLYDGFEIHPVQARRAINCRGDRRGVISEVVVTSYRADER